MLKRTAHNARLRTLAAGLLCLAACLALSAGEAKPATAPDPAVKPAAAQPAAEAAGEWQKIETRVVPLPQPRHILSPGVFDGDLQKTITFPKDGSAVDTGLPHGGQDKDGKPYPPIMARVQQNFIWIDFNGDGKPGSDETRPIAPDGTTNAFTCELHYDDGTAGQYAFCLKTIVEHERFALLRCTARGAEFQGRKLVLLDDNGNGKYDDAGQDVVIVGDNPPCFLGKYLRLGDKFYEVLAHAAGATLEVRPAPKFETGTVDAFEKYKPSQKAENLKLHMLIVTGADYSIGFDERHKTAPVPAGTYDLAFGLLERAKEVVYFKKGEKTSFSVAAGQSAAPVWGGTVKMKFDVSIEEKGVLVTPPVFMGAGSEQYAPENYRVVPVLASIAQCFTDRQRIEHRIPFGQKRYDVLSSGELAPRLFQPYRLANDEYEIAVDYNSGIMGSVTGRVRLQYVPPAKKKTPDKHP